MLKLDVCGSIHVETLFSHLWATTSEWLSPSRSPGEAATTHRVLLVKYRTTMSLTVFSTTFLVFWLLYGTYGVPRISSAVFASCGPTSKCIGVRRAGRPRSESSVSNRM